MPTRTPSRRSNWARLSYETGTLCSVALKPTYVTSSGLMPVFLTSPISQNFTNVRNMFQDKLKKLKDGGKAQSTTPAAGQCHLDAIVYVQT